MNKAFFVQADLMTFQEKIYKRELFLLSQRFVQCLKQALFFQLQDVLQELLSQINEGKVQLQDLHNDPRYRMLCEKVARGE